MIKTKVNNEYKDIIKIFGAGTLQKEIIKIWSREAGTYVYESSVEYTGALPITITANGDALIDYRIYGASGGVGEPTGSGEPAGYKLPMTVRSANLFDEHSPSIPGSIQSDGSIYSRADAKTYDYMMVESNTMYRLKAFEYSESYEQTSRIAWYDENKEFLYRDYRMQGYETLSRVSPTNAKYCRISINNSLSKCVLIKESAMPMEYIPYSKQTVPVYIGDTPLGEYEYVSYSEQKIYKMVNGALTPTDPPVSLPEIPTIDGTTVIDCELADKPSQMYVKYKAKR